MDAGADQLCGTDPSQSRAHFLHPFVAHVMSYNFQEAPNYSKLRFLLEKALLNNNSAPLQDYDFASMEEYFNDKVAIRNQIVRRSYNNSCISNESIDQDMFDSCNIDEFETKKPAQNSQKGLRDRDRREGDDRNSNQIE